MWHAPLSARRLARCVQIRDVHLLRDVIRIDEQLVVVVVRTSILLLGSLLLLELSALHACELGFPCCGRGPSSLLFLLFLFFLLFFVFVRIIFDDVFLDATTRARKESKRDRSGWQRLNERPENAHRLSSPTAVPFSSSWKFRL